MTVSKLPHYCVWFKSPFVGSSWIAARHENITTCSTKQEKIYAMIHIWMSPLSFRCSKVLFIWGWIMGVVFLSGLMWLNIMLGGKAWSAEVGGWYMAWKDVIFVLALPFSISWPPWGEHISCFRTFYHAVSELEPLFAD